MLLKEQPSMLWLGKETGRERAEGRERTQRESSVVASRVTEPFPGQGRLLWERLHGGDDQCLLQEHGLQWAGEREP